MFICIERENYQVFTTEGTSAGFDPNHCRPASKVEVIVSAFNSAGTIRRALDSILMQDIDSDSLCIFLHDDGSTDSTVADALDILDAAGIRAIILAKRSNNFSSERFSYFFKAVYESNSEFLAFLDADDYWTDTGKLRKQIDMLGRNSVAALVHTRFLVRNDVQGKERVQPAPHSPTEDLQSTRLLWRENYIGTLTVMIRKSSLTKEIYPEQARKMLVGDYPIWLSACQDEGQILFVEEVTATYSVHGGNYWANGSPISRLLRTRSVDKQIESVLGKPVGFSIPTRVFRWARRFATKFIRSGSTAWTHNLNP